MPATCTICTSEKREAIERALLEGASNRAIARQHHVGRDALARHSRAGHVPLAIVVLAEHREAVHAVDLADRAELLWSRVRRILDDAEGKPVLELAAIRELRAVVDLLARLAGPQVAPDSPVVIQLSFPGPKDLVEPVRDQPSSPLEPS